MKWLLLIILYSVPCKADCIKINVDKDFGSNQKVIVKTALKDWEKASKGKICFSYNEVNVSKPTNFMRDNLITIYSGNHPWHFVVSKRVGCEYSNDHCMAITVRGDNRTSDIFVSMNNEKFLSLMRHEIGHVLGLDHSRNYSDIMYSYIRIGMEISLRDRARLMCLIETDRLLKWRNDCE